MAAFAVRPVGEGDLDWMHALMDEHWGGQTQVENGEVYRPADLPGFVAVQEGERIGYAPYRIDGDACTVALLHSLREGRGVGTALVQAVVAMARERGCSRVRVVTTNDNVRAQRFYERLGFRMVEVRPGAVVEARKVKPTIPLTGEGGVPITDEIGYGLSLG